MSLSSHYLQNYLAAVAAIGTAAALHLGLRATIGISPSAVTFLYVLALLVSAWRGFGPGYLTLFLGVAVVPYLYRPNHSLTRIDLYAVLMLAAVSTATSWIARMRDRIEAELREENERANSAVRRQLAEVESLYSKLPVGLCFLDADLRFMRVNEKFAAMHGAPANALIGRPYHELVNGRMSDVVVPLLRTVIASGTPFIDYELAGPLLAESGDNRDWMMTCSRVETPEHTIVGLQVVVQDITYRKRAERDLARANDNLKQFNYLAAHDLQEPLRTIVNYSELTHRRAGSTVSAETGAHLRLVADAAKRMSGMIADLLAYTRDTAQELVLKPVELELVVSSTVESLTHLIEENGATVVRAPLPIVAGDGSRLAQVFQNLIANSIKYRRREVAPVVRITAREQEGLWVIAVEDNGQGFDERHADQIFGIFKRLHGSSVSGSGIGLAICKGVIERHGGTIWAKSVVGEGTTFFFTLRPAAAGRGEPYRSTSA